MSFGVRILAEIVSGVVENFLFLILNVLSLKKIKSLYAKVSLNKNQQTSLLQTSKVESTHFAHFQKRNLIEFSLRSAI
jgi:hypothetical protein